MSQSPSMEQQESMELNNDDNYNNSNTETWYDYQYLYTVLFVISMFILLTLCVMYLFDSKIPGTHYEGNCLLDLATTYRTKGCLDN